MKDIDRDMYYGGYGYSGFSPMGAFPNQMPGTMQQQMNSSNMPNNYSNSWYNDINERLERLERQVKRLDQRLTRLETPYANSSSKYNNEPDNNMYMM